MFVCCVFEVCPEMGGSISPRLMSVLMRGPAKFLDQALMIANPTLSLLFPRKPTYKTSDLGSFIGRLVSAFGRDFNAALCEAEILGEEAGVPGGMEALPTDATFEAFYNGEFTFVKLCYAAFDSLTLIISSNNS